MDICEQSQALPFDVYQRFIEILKGKNKKMHDYVGKLGLLIEDKDKYEESVSKAKWPSENFLRREWEKIAGNWRFTHLADIDLFCSELELLSNPVAEDGTILFGGCGNGDIAEWIRENTNAEMICIDHSPAMVREYRKFRPEAVCVLGDCRKLPFRDGTFNQYFATGVYDESSCNKLMTEASRVLMPGGEVRMDSLIGYDLWLPLDIRNYGDFERFFMKRYECQKIKDAMIHDIDKTDLSVEIRAIENAGLKSSYKFSRNPSLPRYASVNKKMISPGVISGYDVPFVIIGKKI